ncbi:MAG TPA: hypothetical protein PLC52_11005 [Anaerolineales bacterium]|nr:hypothetical protein [Anaerolineales bacterium]HRQ93374.1 hypothetical protein [Anaerolineales bacterium]
MKNTWNEFSAAATELFTYVKGKRSIHINSAEDRENIKTIPQLYFRQIKPELQLLGVNQSLINNLDSLMEGLIRKTQRRTTRASFLAALKAVENLINEVDVARELQVAENEFGRQASVVVLSNLESLVYESLMKIIPAAALSYKQAIIDLKQVGRLSYRGAANELRETLRETLDYLAPDKEVTAQSGFKLEKNQTKPTMKQKANYILKARGAREPARKTASETIDVVEEKVASLARTTYTRSAVSTHVRTEQTEVMWMKNYVDALLAELLGLKST